MGTHAATYWALPDRTPLSRRDRIVTIAVASALPALVLAGLVALTSGDLSGVLSHQQTLEMFPLGPLQVAVATLTGLVLGLAFGRAVLRSERTKAITLGLAVLAPPVGGFLVVLLTTSAELTAGGDPSRATGALFTFLPFSYIYGFPAALVTSLIGIPLVRRLAEAPDRRVAATLAALSIPGAIVAGQAVAITLSKL